MEAERRALLDDILQRYAGVYDVKICKPEEEPLQAVAAYHEHGTGYMLVRKAELWTADRHEYDFFFSVPELTQEVYEQCLARTLAEGEPLVEPRRGHMSTVLAMVILCDTAEESALGALKRLRIRKNFRLSLWGWMEVQAAAVELGRNTVAANPPARTLVKFLKGLLKRRG